VEKWPPNWPNIELGKSTCANDKTRTIGETERTQAAKVKRCEGGQHVRFSSDVVNQKKMTKGVRGGKQEKRIDEKGTKKQVAFIKKGI